MWSPLLRWANRPRSPSAAVAVGRGGAPLADERGEAGMRVLDVLEPGLQKADPGVPRRGRRHRRADSGERTVGADDQVRLDARAVEEVHPPRPAALMAPGDDGTALRLLFAELLDRTENTHMVAALMAGADVRHDMGEEHPAAPTGWFAPALDLTTGDGHTRRLAELLREARPLLLDLTGGNDLAAAAEPWTGRVHRVTATADDPPAPALLIRPTATSPGRAPTPTA
ncbi:hypothetical protein MTP10_27530 [Nonomuraea sp. 3-1Str]|nr:hypothetical protein [Nonomuraea sp. 3-1Str]MDR8412467.1 hypothetical protein [Nonomuraea sp. 3-1Str]